MARILLPALGLLICLAGVAEADTVTLKNGREIHGRLIKETRTHLHIRVAQGGVLRLEKARIATFSENSNYGEGYAGSPTTGGSSGATESTADKPDDKPNESGKTAKSGPGAGEGEDWIKDLGPPHESFDDASADKILERLKELRSPEARFIGETEATKEEQQTIQSLFDQMGYARKVGNRGRRGQAREKLKEFGVKVLPHVDKQLSSGNFYRRLNTARLVASLAAKDDAWRFYTHKFNLVSSLIPMVGDQSTPQSFGLRAAANEALEKLTGASMGFRPNSDQFRTAAQADALSAWKGWWAKEQEAWIKAEKERSKAWDETLALWKNGPKKDS